MDFISAVKALKEGKCVGIYRSGWNPGGLRIVMSEFEWLRRTDGLIDLLHARDFLTTDWELVPKPKVKKVVEGWINVYLYGGPTIGEGIWRTQEEACNVRSCGREYLGGPRFIRHEYEVEE
jgi:hypothetical protein